MPRKPKTIKRSPPARSSATVSPVSQDRPATPNERLAILGVCLFLTTAIWLIYGQTLRYGFINLDDEQYVLKNPFVERGLTSHGIIWAFTHIYADNWHPLTWISHMLDCQFYGLNPAGHHFSNVLFHNVTAILLFLVLRQMTGLLWRSAFVAAVFAVHPLRVESVAWVAERKDVLSGVFFMLTLGAYTRYVQQQSSVKRQESNVKNQAGIRLLIFNYFLVVFFFAMGLMCKPMLVTVPFILLLLDYWPLNRFVAVVPGEGFLPILRRLTLEKVPLFGLAAVVCVITLFAQTQALVSVGNIPLNLRVGNALISCATYLRQMFWPSGLSIMYPFLPPDINATKVVLSLVVLAGISTVVFMLRRFRYLVTGWLWYVIMLTPVIGIVQVGVQARADRYTYLPEIGLYWSLAWAAAELCASWHLRRFVLGGVSVSLLVSLIFFARRQAGYWQTSETLWLHTLACTSNNYVAYDDLGYVFVEEGRMDEAVTQFQKSLQLAPNYPDAHFNLGNALLTEGNVNEAMFHFEKTLQLAPDSADAHVNLGNLLFDTGDVNEAVSHYQKALKINPDYVDAHVDLGNALFFKMGDPRDAIVHYQKALQIDPDNAQAQMNLAAVLAICPDASVRNGKRAIDLALSANQLTGGQNPHALETLAAAYAEAGRFPEAVETAQHALQLAETQSDTASANNIRSQLKLYQAGIPFRYPQTAR